MSTVSVRECEFVNWRPVMVLAGRGYGWYGQPLGTSENATPIRFVIENALLQKESRDIKPGDVVEVATIKCPSGALWIGHFDVLIDSVVYKHGTVFMIRMLQRGEKGNSNGE